MAYEIEHISNHEERVWLRTAIESGRYRKPLSPEEKKALLRRLTEGEGMERYLRRGLPWEGRSRGAAQTPVASRLLDRWDPAHHRQQPDRLYDRSRRRAVHPIP